MMRVSYSNLKNMVKTTALQEAETPKSGAKKSKFDKEGAVKYKDAMEAVGRRFTCPRHNLPLMTKWTRIQKTDPEASAADAARRRAGLAQYGNVQPPTKDRPDLLPSKGSRFGFIPKFFFCPYMEEEAVKGEEWRQVGSEKLPDAYTVSTYETETDPKTGKPIKDATGRPKMKSVEKAMMCDYRVTPRYSKPGQISQFYARGEVAEEEEESGNLRRDRPKQAPSDPKQKASKHLLNIIADMEEKGYHFKQVTAADAADQVFALVRSKGIRGIKAIALGQEGDKPTIELVTKLPWDRLKGMPTSVAGFDVRAVEKPSKGSERMDPTSPSFAASRRRGYEKKGFMKLKMERNAEGKPIFSRDDVIYLAWHQSPGKPEQGQTFMKAEEVEALLNSMGWEMQAGSRPVPEERPTVPPKQAPGALALSAGDDLDVDADDDEDDEDYELAAMTQQRKLIQSLDPSAWEMEPKEPKVPPGKDRDLDLKRAIWGDDDEKGTP